MHPTQLAIGMMTGSSMDGIDAALIETDGHHYVRTLATACSTFSPAFQLALRIAEYAVQQTAGHLAQATMHFPQYITQYLDSTPVTTHIRNALSTYTLDRIMQCLTEDHATLVKRLL